MRWKILVGLILVVLGFIYWAWKEEQDKLSVTDEKAYKEQQDVNA